jgi:Spy/CpxP family protein refolding chaperone
MGGALAMIGGLISIGVASGRLPIIVARAQSTGPPAAAMPTASPSEMPLPNHRRHRDTFIQSLKTLNLSELQETQIHAILVAARTQDKSVRGSGIRANDADAHTKIEAVLSPAQRTQFNQELDTAAKTQ